MNLLKKQRPASVLGLTLDGSRLEAVVLRRSGSSLQVKQHMVATLALSPLGGDPALVGREIRNHLSQAGIGEKRCVICLPASWVLTVQTALPDLAEADVESFLQIEAERGFPSGHENLFIANSRARAASGEQFATLVGVSRSHLDTLETVLRAAQLKPLSFVLGLAALEGETREGGPGSFALALGSNSVELGAASGGGLVAMRSLDGAIETNGPQKSVDVDLVARELRITLGQLPAPLTEGMRSVKVFARGELARQFVNDIAPRIQAMGLRLETTDRASGAEFTAPLPPEIALSPALAAAANFVLGIASGPELLPPKISALQQWMASSVAFKKLGWAGLAAAGIALLVGGAFGYQEFQLQRWQAQRNKIDKQAVDVKAAQAQINKYRAWYDETSATLNILKALAEAFPTTGSQATAKSVLIHNVSDGMEVTCSGIAAGGTAFHQMLNELTKNASVTNLTIDALTGNQFTIKFQWEGGGSGN